MARDGITFHHPRAFWLGSVAVTVGVLLHLPMYAGAADMGYRLVGMPVDGPMKVGMALVLIGLAATVYGLIPSLSAAPRAASTLRVRALDDAKVSSAHVALLVVMAIAVTIDVMKPVTLSFVAPVSVASTDSSPLSTRPGPSLSPSSPWPASPARSSAR